MNRIGAETDALIRKLLSEGASMREVARRLGVNKDTVLRRAGKNTTQALPPAQNGPSRCDFCGSEIAAKREFYRRTRRTKHKFCRDRCYRDFYAALRAGDRCKSCGRQRAAGHLHTLVRGYCPACYATLRLCGFDLELFSLNRLNGKLKQEIIRVYPNHPKYR